MNGALYLFCLNTSTCEEQRLEWDPVKKCLYCPSCKAEWRDEQEYANASIEKPRMVVGS